MKTQLYGARWLAALLILGTLVEATVVVWYHRVVSHQSALFREYLRFNPFVAKPIDSFAPWLVLIALVTVLGVAVWSILRLRMVVPHWHIGQLLLAFGVGIVLTWVSWLSLRDTGTVSGAADAVWSGVFAGTIAGSGIAAFSLAWIWFGARRKPDRP